MHNAIWQVQVFGGDDSPLGLDAPMKFGTPVIYATPLDGVKSDEAPEGVTVPLVYGPVGLHQFKTFLAITTDGEPVDMGGGQIQIPQRNWREMEHILSMEFSRWGHIEVEGLERRKDGTAMFVRWEIEVYVDDEVEATE